MAEVTNYQCPSCNAPLHFDSQSGKLVCDYCQSSFTAEEVDAYYAKKDGKAEQAAEQTVWDTGDINKAWDADGEGVKAYSCPSCGAQLICSDTTAATSCPYCGNNTIVPGQLSGAVKPNYVIPFKLDKEAAMEALKGHYKGKLFLPSSFRTQNHIAKIRGLYVPFWLFDCKADVRALFRATRSHTHTEGDTRVTTTEHFKIVREGSLAFDNIPVDGSKSMPDAHMDSIEPFDYSALEPFKNAYLAGYLADRYDVSSEESFERASERAKQSAVDAMKDSVTGYSTVETAWHDVKLDKGMVKYAMLPVYMLNTKWKDKDFLFAMNGQTGKLVGDLPVSWLKVLLWFLGLGAAATIIIALIIALI